MSRKRVKYNSKKATSVVYNAQTDIIKKETPTSKYRLVFDQLISNQINSTKVLFWILALLLPFVIEYFIPNKKMIIIIAVIVAALFTINLLKGLFRNKIIKYAFVLSIILLTTIINWEFINNKNITSETKTVGATKQQDSKRDKDTVYIKTTATPTININNIYEQKPSVADNKNDLTSISGVDFNATPTFIDFMNRNKYGLLNYSSNSDFSLTGTNSFLDSSMNREEYKSPFGAINLNYDNILNPEKFKLEKDTKPTWLNNDFSQTAYKIADSSMQNIINNNLYSKPEIIDGLKWESIESDDEKYSYCLRIDLESRISYLRFSYSYKLSFSGKVEHFEYDPYASSMETFLGPPHTYDIMISVLPENDGINALYKVPELHIKAYSNEKIILLN